ncbi:hypothetical protein LWI28_007949 [Acer negundo]|uniref:Uncharacterized protein n=1 Tax=Acer negundo TaxID=4023 RepID=A0AAD5IA02_ACENE|nr:hypothetical protein LWI28_007949 [Acer negundo]KAK4836077.1 hypothetical protein QYF36_018208 [Acer negundo]
MNAEPVPDASPIRKARLRLLVGVHYGIITLYLGFLDCGFSLIWMEIPEWNGFSCICRRANKHQPQQQGTMTNRVRHLATSARKRNVVMVEAFFPLLVKGAWDVRRVCAFRTTTRLVVLGRIPPLNIRDRGKVAGPAE